MSRSLCFYSVSNPLGRPRGTKKNKNRGGSKGRNAWERDDVSNGDAMATMVTTTGDRRSRKRTQPRRNLTSHKGNNDDRSSSMPINLVMSNGYRDGTSDPLGSGSPAPGDNPPFVPTHHRYKDVGMSDAAVPNDFRLSSLNPADNGPQGLGHTLPHNFGYSDLERSGMLDVARSDFGTLPNPDTRNPITWDNPTYNIDGEDSSALLRTSAEDLDFSNIPKVKKSP